MWTLKGAASTFAVELLQNGIMVDSLAVEDYEGKVPTQRGQHALEPTAIAL